MGARHRRGSRRAARITRIGVATATATALAVSVAPPQAPQKPEVYQNVDLAAAIRLLPNHDQVPDITGGLGTVVYDASQTLADQLSRALVNGINFAALAQAAGVDPQSLVTTLLAKIPSSLLPAILATLSQDVPVLGPVLQGLDLDVLTEILNQLGIDEVSDATLTGLLALIGLNLADPLNLSNLALPGVNLITAGPTFTALKLLGLDLGWVPGLPNSVAREINGSEYLKVGVDGLLDLVLDRVNQAAGGPILGGILQSLGVSLSQVVTQLTGLIGQVTNPVGDLLPDLIDIRVTPTVGIGLGAFAAAMAYQKVIADLANQPGGSNYEALTGELNPLLGSLTILPLILINNPARPDGGALARFGALAALFGIDTVNPKTELTGEGGSLDLPLGLHVGGANVLPVLVDATYEYEPLSDLASWPNAVTLFNNLAAGLSPTYLLRGLSLEGLTDQLAGQLGNVGVTPLSLNLYLTLHSATLPTLEPLYLASDFLNLVGLAPLAKIPMRIANALAPALRILTDVGYSNVVRNADGTYTRDYSTAGTETPFLSFPNLNPGLVISDTINALIGGIQKELGPNPTPNTPNVLANLINAIFGGGGLGGILGGLAPLAATQATTQAASLLSVTDVPSTSARMLSLTGSADEESTDGSATAAKGGAKAEDAVVATESEPTEVPAEAVVADVTPAVTPPSAEDESTPPKHAKPEEDAAPVPDSETPPKHAKDDEKPAADDDAATPKPDKPKPEKPALNVVRDSLNASPTKDDKPGEKAGDSDKKAEPSTVAADSPSKDASEGNAA